MVFYVSLYIHEEVKRGVRKKVPYTRWNGVGAQMGGLISVPIYSKS
jgi:hypothetical protein